MRHFPRLFLAAAVTLAVMAFVATAAQAAEGPYYTVESVRLEGKTSAKLSGKIAKTYVLTAGAIKITCTKQTIEGATIIGSVGANGAAGETTMMFESCSVVENGAKCEVEGKKFTTTALKTTLAFTNKESKAGEILLIHLAPAAGTIAKLKFTGECTTKETILEGSIDAEAWSGAKAIKGSEEPVDTTTGEVNFPAAAVKTSFIEEEKKRKEVKPTLFAFGKAATLEGRSELTLASGEAWSVASALPPPPQIEQIDFLGNEEVLIDHRKDANHTELVKLRKEGLPAPEKPIKITQFGALDKIEWKSPALGALATNWPLAYRKTTLIKMKARFALEAGTKAFLEKQLEGEPTLTGKTTIGGVAMTFEATIKDVAAQIAAHGTYLETPEIDGLVALANKVKYEAATITWKWTAKEKGRAVAITQKTGKSTHNIYTTAAAATSTIYLTLLDLDTQNIELETQPPEPPQVLAGTWKGFSNFELGLPSVHIRIYDPATGELKRTGALLWYYEEIKPNLTLEQVLELALPAACSINQTEGLLEWATGECGSWQAAFGSALGIEGASDTNAMIVVQSGKGPCAKAGTCAFLVTSWKFEGKGTSGDPEFPYKESEVVDTNGVAGQGVANPASAFGNHQVVEAEHKLYDPSYGTEPLGKGKEGPLGEGVEAEEIRLAYQEKAVSGFCLFAVEPLEYHCRKAVKGEGWLKFL